ncbi:Ldh family oxidoreductase [Halorarius litoreus]|uniref:Ldh family oxidoreductase n=1 Tax=Halorarius litoreus TaxID=2962676 RepID=UPI0020CF3FE3|nr:Ldh family oxidoreductase [Halorarius litoreus]
MTTVEPAELRTFATRLLADLGAPDDVAEMVAASLVDADLKGHTSHGVLRIPTYQDMIDDDALVPDETPAIIREDETTAVVDGRLAYGQVVGRLATHVLVEKAHRAGLAAVGIRNGTHLGRMGEWAERATEDGLIFSSFVHSSGGGLVTALAGTADRTFSTNPVTYGVPTFDRLPFPLVLDMASSQVAHGKIQEYEAAGRTLPGEWALSPDGEPLTDPEELSEFQEAEDWGALRPLGGTTAGYKGTGLAVIVEMLAGLLGGGPVIGQRDPSSWFSNGATFLAIDPERFSDRATMAAKVESMATQFRAAESLPNVPVGDGARGDDPLLPGEAEYLTAQERADGGVPLPERVVEALTAVAADLDIEPPFDDAAANS